VFLNFKSLKPILLTFNYYFQNVTRCNVIRCAALEFLISPLAILLSLHFVPTRWMVGENVSSWVISQDSLHHLEHVVSEGHEHF
jgi:hypothetical protein